jgi:hypothetical protein
MGLSAALCYLGNNIKGGDDLQQSPRARSEAMRDAAHRQEQARTSVQEEQQGQVVADAASLSPSSRAHPSEAHLPTEAMEYSAGYGDRDPLVVLG